MHLWLADSGADWTMWNVYGGCRVLLERIFLLPCITSADFFRDILLPSGSIDTTHPVKTSARFSGEFFLHRKGSECMNGPLLFFFCNVATLLLNLDLMPEQGWGPFLIARPFSWQISVIFPQDLEM
jgi:hypothetical protein